MGKRSIVAAGVITVALAAASAGFQSDAPGRADTVTILHNFSGPEGATPSGGLVEAGDGNLYGSTSAGGPAGGGAFFRIDTNGTLTVVNYPASSSQRGLVNFVLGSDGMLYGTASGTTSTGGGVFRMSTSGSVSTLHAFHVVSPSYRAHPYGPLVEGPDGNFYGTTYEAVFGSPPPGGVGTFGTAFRVTPGGVTTTLHDFTREEGANPYGGLALGPDGNFYGTTSSYGANYGGSVFRMTPAGQVTTIHHFAGAGGGRKPLAGLCLGRDGNFYGTTSEGGAFNYGTVFRITPAGALTVLHSFTGTNGEGLYPWAPVIQASDGLFYGVTRGDGNSSTTCCGTVFQMTPSGQLTTLFKFSSVDGAWPTAPLVEASDGNLYGTTPHGGDRGPTQSVFGTVFRVNLPPVAPAFTSNPSNRTVRNGESTSFSVTASGRPAPAFQWQQSSDGGVTWASLTNVAPFSGVTSSTLSLSGIPGGLNGARFRAVAANAGGSVTSAAAMLTVVSVPDPRMALDGPVPNATVRQPFLTGGWATDLGAPSGSGIDAIHVWAFPVLNGVVDGAHGRFVAQGQGGGVRGDVAAVFGSQFVTSGFTFTVSGLPAGAYELGVYARSTVSGSFSQARFVRITVADTSPVMSLDGPKDNTTVPQPFLTGGWAIDRSATTGSGVDDIHVWAFPVVGDVVDPTNARFVAQGTTGGSRPDVGAVYGGQFTNSGYTFVISGLPTGQYILGVYARSTVTSTFSQAKFARITIQ